MYVLCDAIEQLQQQQKRQKHQGPMNSTAHLLQIATTTHRN